VQAVEGRRKFGSVKFAGLLAIVAAALPLWSQTNKAVPVPLKGVGIDEQVGKSIDLNLEFTNEKGYQQPLKDFFKQGRPVLLNLVYYNCPMLCNLLLNGQVEALGKIPWTPGDKYEVVTVSINPEETFDLAAAKKQTYLAGFDNRAAFAAHWHFLTDYAGNSKKLADQIGFHYRWDPRIQNFAHTAAIMFLSPTGKICRYLYGIKFKPLDMRLAFTEASQNKFSFSVDRLLLFCYHYDPKANSYTAFAVNFMRTGAVLIVLFLLVFVWRLFRTDKLKHHAEREEVALTKER
jgi:protein SCO1/2